MTGLISSKEIISFSRINY